MGPLYAKPARNVPTQQKVIEINDDNSEDSVSEDEDNERRVPVVEIPHNGGAWLADRNG